MQIINDLKSLSEPYTLFANEKNKTKFITCLRDKLQIAVIDTIQAGENADVLIINSANTKLQNSSMWL